MDYFANWRDAIKPYLVDFSKFTGIIRFRLFRFQRVEKEVNLWAKNMEN